MGKQSIDRLIINNPFEEPKQHWSYDRATRTFELLDGRRPAGYIIASSASMAFDDPGIFVPIPLVNIIRPRVKKWRQDGYPGATGITKRLLGHWNNPDERENRRLFFCQLEAIETLIWLAEAHASDRVGIDIPSDGGSLKRICSKMATGSGKTIVMAMLVAWQIINKATYPQDSRFSKNIFVVAPGLTVKSRLQVLAPTSEGNYYDEFNIVPYGLVDRLRQGKILIRNWHALSWETDEYLAKKRSVDKRGPKSDEAYVREVLSELASVSNIVVINDEAHHAWRVPATSKIKGVKKEEIEEATKWVGGLDRIHRSRNILCCYDFSATPFTPTGKQSTEEALFGWIVSDFGLNDAIESGLVKTPRVVIRDDALPDVKSYKPKLYHIYEHVRDDLNRKAQEHEPLPRLVDNAYYLLGKDWLETKDAWENAGMPTPPVMITVANRTETAARIKYSFDHKKIKIEELCLPKGTLHIDSRVLEMAEAREDEHVESLDEVDRGKAPKNRKISKVEMAERLRKTVDTVGQVGKPGEKVNNVISVGMLSEGWDAKTVTHIMGIRAFTSQLLCEQVVGRGLRRTSYEVNPETGMFDSEYVNIFGVPFTFLPHESHEDVIPQPPKPKTLIQPDPEKKAYEISWPNVIRIDHVFKPKLELDLKEVKTLELNADDVRTIAEMAPAIDGKPDITNITEIDLEALGRRFRTQRIIFETTRDVFDQMEPSWERNKDVLLAQLIEIIEGFIKSDKIVIKPPLFNSSDIRRRIVITLCMSEVVQHIWEAIRFQNTQHRIPIFNSEKPIRSSGDMIPWYTGKPCVHNIKSHINLCPYDSTWEATEAFEFDHNEYVEAWVKNDHIGFEIYYIYQGEIKKYRPDFIIRLANGKRLILEVKGKDTPRERTKREFLQEWVEAINDHGGFGKWYSDISFDPSDVSEIIYKLARG